MPRTKKPDKPRKVRLRGIALSGGRMVCLGRGVLAGNHAIMFVSEEGKKLKFALSDEAMRALIRLYQRPRLRRGTEDMVFTLEPQKEHLALTWQLVPGDGAAGED